MIRICSLLLLALFANDAHAFDINHYLSSQGAEPTLGRPAKEKACANFDGQWSGRCISDLNEVRDINIKIIQDDCDRIKLGLSSLKINGANTHQEFSEKSMFTEALSTHWQDSLRQVMVIESSLNAKNLADNRVLTRLTRTELAYEANKNLSLSSESAQLRQHERIYCSLAVVSP